MPRTFRPFRRQPPVVAPRTWSGFVTRAYRRPLRAGASHPFGTTASLGLRLSLAGSPRRLAESRSSLSYGRVVHLPLLPTPPHGDAVTFGYAVQTQPRRGLAPRRYRTPTSARVLGVLPACGF